jgi:hypothetical protein
MMLRVPNLPSEDSLWCISISFPFRLPHRLDDVVERDLLPTCRGPVRSWIRAGSWRRFRRVPTRSVVTCEFRHTRIIIKIYLMNVRQPLSRPSREIAGWLVGDVVRSPECFARSSSDGCAKEPPNEVGKPIRRFSFHLVSN